MTKEELLRALSSVIDPDFRKDIVTLGMVQDIEINGRDVRFSLNLTTPACPLKEMFRQECNKAVENAGFSDINLEINMTSSVTSSKDNSGLYNIKNIIAIASGKGGVGKSTVSANLAVALAKEGSKVGLIDADIFGPSVPTMFNCEHEQPTVVSKDGKSWIVPLEQYGVKLLSIGFLSPADSPIIWRGPMASSALKQFFMDTEWGELDYLLIDLPPGTSDIHLTLVQTVSVTGAVIVSTPQKVALADAVKGLQMFKQPQISVPILGVVENMAYFTPEELPNNKYYIFGQNGCKELAKNYDVPFLGEVPLVQSVRESGDNGYPVVLKNELVSNSFKEIAGNLARQVAIQNAKVQDIKIEDIKA